MSGPYPAWKWDADHKSTHTEVTDNGVVATFQKSGSSGNAGVRGTHAMRGGIHTWQVLLTSSGGTSTQVCRDSHPRC